MATEEQPTADFNGSSRQREFIEDLVDKIGYRDAPTREKFLHRVLERCRDRDGTSDVIDWLLEQLALRRNAQPVNARGKTIAATDLATFAFCPASYAIEKTFRVPPSVEMMAGEVQHKERKLESFLDSVRGKREREFEDGTAGSGFEDEESFVYRGDYGEVLRSEPVHRGHRSTNEGPFYDENGEIPGNPDYIFRRPEGDHIIVEEKHTRRSARAQPLPLQMEPTARHSEDTRAAAPHFP
jgi:hypothetical protein